LFSRERGVHNHITSFAEATKSRSKERSLSLDEATKSRSKERSVSLPKQQKVVPKERNVSFLLKSRSKVNAELTAKNKR
jgi:hypothetical protein